MSIRKVKVPFLQIDRSHGLPSSQLHGISIDAQNTVWIATPAGLTLYDGLRVNVFTNQHGLGTHGLRCLQLFNDQLLIGTDLGLDLAEIANISSDNPKSFAPLLNTNKENLGFCEAIAVFNKEFWLGTSTGLYKFQHNTASLQEYELILADFIEEIVVISDTKMLVLGRNQGLYLVSEAKVEKLELDFLSHRKVQSIAVDQAADSIVLIAAENKIYRFSHERFDVQEYSFEPMINADITSIYSDHTEIWLGTTKGLYKSQFNTGETTLNLTQLIEGSYINDIKSDTQNNLYVATNDSGLFKFSVLRKVLTEFDVDSVFSIRPKHSAKNHDQYYLATLRGVRLFEVEKGVYPYSPLQHLDLHCWDVLQRNNTLLLASVRGLLKVDLADFKVLELGSKNLIAAAPNRIFLELAEGVLLGTQAGLVFIQDDNSLHTIEPKDNHNFGYVYSLAKDIEGNVLVGTIGKGLWFGEKIETLDSNGVPEFNFSKITSDYLTENSNIYCIRLSQDGRIAVSCNNRILVLSKDLSNINVLYTSDNAVAGWSMQWEDVYSLWVGGSNGLYELDVRKQSESRRIESIPGSSIWEFNSSRSLEFINTDDHRFSKYTRDNWRDSQNKALACGMRNNLTVLNLMNIRSIIARPKFIKGKHEWQGQELEVLLKDDHHISTGKWFLQIHLKTDWSIDIESLKHRYRLVGYDSNWSELSERKEIIFNSLPPGLYIVEVQAYSMVFGWGDITQVFKFEVLTRGFFSKVFASFVGGYYALKKLATGITDNRKQIDSNIESDEYVKYRTRELELQKQQLDELNQQLSEEVMIDSLTGIANRRYLDKVLVDTVSFAKRKQSSLSVLLIDVDNFKAYNDFYGHLAGDDALKQLSALITSIMRRGGDTFARYGGEEFMLVLPDGSTENALALAHRIHAVISEASIPHVRNHEVSGYISVSIGIATADCARLTSFTVDELISLADKNLYIAKSLGRNQTRYSSLKSI